MHNESILAENKETVGRIQNYCGIKTRRDRRSPTAIDKATLLPNTPETDRNRGKEGRRTCAYAQVRDTWCHISNHKCMLETTLISSTLTDTKPELFNCCSHEDPSPFRTSTAVVETEGIARYRCIGVHTTSDHKSKTQTQLQLQFKVAMSITKTKHKKSRKKKTNKNHENTLRKKKHDNQNHET